VAVRAPFFEIHVPPVMHDLQQGITVTDYSGLYKFCDYIDIREDCNDFRMISLQRLYIQYNDQLPEEVKNRIKQTVLNFRYWMTEPGADNMCFWSENHQLLFASIEYVGAALFKNDVFTNEGKSGKEKTGYAKERINHWFDQRFRTGFIEWHSHVYYAEDLGALLHLIDFAEDKEIQEKATIITDLLFLDVAMHSFKGNFALTHGRSYEKQKKQPSQADIAPIVSDAFGLTDVPYDPSHIGAIFSYRMNYTLPSVIKEIAQDESTIIIKDQMGYDLKKIHQELDFNNPLDRFVIWQMEGFSNPEIINHSIDMLNQYDLFSNEFLSDFKIVSHPLLRKWHILPLLSKILRPVTDGVAIQQVNTYTYKTKEYSMSTAQRHQAGTCGDQQHIMNVCIGSDFNIFITHPAVIPYADDNAYLSLSPNNWVGNGRMPDSVQDENVNISMFRVPGRKKFMEKVLINHTHAYFPTQYFDTYDISGRYAFMQYKKVLLAFICKNSLRLENTDELIQEGRYTTWITEVSTADAETYEEFKERIQNNIIRFSRKDVMYQTNDKEYWLTFRKQFKINREVINTEYRRFETPYIQGDRNSEEYTVSYNNKKVTWNLSKLIRKEENQGNE
jgi:hypothetical protein